MAQKDLPANTALLLRAAAGVNAMSGLTLVGGTALALQLHHRQSEDLDFAVHTDRLPRREIDMAVRALRDCGMPVAMATSTGEISSFRINTGLDLLDYVQEYVIGDVKVQFFVHGKTREQMDFYSAAQRISHPDLSPTFGIMGIEGLAVSKSLIIEDRVTSRDLFDLYALCQAGHLTTQSILKNILTLGLKRDGDLAKAVLIGDVPVSMSDPGLIGKDTEATLVLIRKYFFDEIRRIEKAAVRDALFGM